LFQVKYSEARWEKLEKREVNRESHLAEKTAASSQRFTIVEKLECLHLGCFNLRDIGSHEKKGQQINLGAHFVSQCPKRNLLISCIWLVVPIDVDEGAKKSARPRLRLRLRTWPLRL
jgi:hypothetical protein